MTKKQMEYRVNEVLKLEAQIKELEERKNRYKKELQSEMEEMDQNAIEVCGRTVKNTYVESSKFDTKKFKEDSPDVYSKYIISSGYYRFSIN